MKPFTVDVRCTWCGPVQLKAADLRCRLAPRNPAEGLCEFTCPGCSRLILRPIAAGSVGLLPQVGVSRLAGPVPFELLEPHPDRALTWDDVLDAVIALERGCCPQDELLSHPQ